MSASVLAVLQARTSSRRLPGKVLKPILDRPMLLRQIERLQRSAAIDQLLVATSDDASDDTLAAVCREAGIECRRGALHDVLDRFWHAVREERPDHVVRLTGDCPLADPAVVDAVVNAHIAADADYTSNAIPHPTWPDGLDVEVVRYEALAAAWREATLASDREHVLPFVWRQSSRFRLHSVSNETDLSGLRWTVDEPSDFAFVTAVYEYLYPRNPTFTTAEVLALLRQCPELQRLNADIGRNAGYAESVAADLAATATKDQR